MAELNKAWEDMSLHSPGYFVLEQNGVPPVEKGAESEEFNQFVFLSRSPSDVWCNGIKNISQTVCLAVRLMFRPFETISILMLELS